LDSSEQADYVPLYKAMQDRAVFVPADPSSFPKGLLPGMKHTTTDGGKIKFRTVPGANGATLVPAATTQDSDILKAGFVGMRWTGFLEMALKLDASCAGVVLQGKRSWVAFNRERIQLILERSWA
jgi:hypothetical protein